MSFVIVTGMSGAGKSQAANALEDIGYFCVDNIPPAIIPSFVELSARSGDELNKIALVTDARGGNMFSEISDFLEDLEARSINFKILYLVYTNERLFYTKGESYVKNHCQKVRAFNGKCFLFRFKKCCPPNFSIHYPLRRSFYII